jgi:hypothetical protein
LVETSPSGLLAKRIAPRTFQILDRIRRILTDMIGRL